MKKNVFFIPVFAFISMTSAGQTCKCSDELSFIQKSIETNYAGFKDKLKSITKSYYEKQVNILKKQAKDKYAAEKCLLIISQYLDIFKDDHIRVSANFDASKPDSLLMKGKERIIIPAAALNRLEKENAIEGIYTFLFDSSYTIAVLKNKTALRDYAGVILESKLPQWKKGMIKFEAKKVDDSKLKGVLYLRNHKPRVDWFRISKDQIGWDWQRKGTHPVANNEPYEPVVAKKLTNKTFYIKVSGFDPSNAKAIDSVFKLYKSVLDTIPNLVLDVRNNGGGSDFAFKPILPYLYTNPVKTTGVDVLATATNIEGWKKILEDKDIPDESKKSIRVMIDKMEKNKDRLVNISEDETDSSLIPLNYPQKIAILINEGCASTTEQFLLFAMQSSKVTLIGSNTSGTLDYSNMREIPFSCMPYILDYATTRSRRLDIGQGIDEKGIQPHVQLSSDKNWTDEAVKYLEKK